MYHLKYQLLMTKYIYEPEWDVEYDNITDKPHFTDRRNPTSLIFVAHLWTINHSIEQLLT